jgi:hypothetical protein
MILDGSGKAKLQPEGKGEEVNLIFRVVPEVGFVRFQC